MCSTSFDKNKTTMQLPLAGWISNLPRGKDFKSDEQEKSCHGCLKYGTLPCLLTWTITKTECHNTTGFRPVSFKTAVESAEHDLCARGILFGK